MNQKQTSADDEEEATDIYADIAISDQETKSSLLHCVSTKGRQLLKNPSGKHKTEKVGCKHKQCLAYLDIVFVCVACLSPA